MDEKEKIKLKKTYEDLPEEKLLEMLSGNASEYKEGSYALMMEVARERGILKEKEFGTIDNRAKEQIKKGNIDEFEALLDQKKSSWFALLLNIVLPGLGLIYCGRYILGAIVFIATAITAIIVATTVASLAEYIDFILYYWLFLVVISFHVAKKYNDILDKKIKATMKVCPMCIERIHPIAKVCKHCGHKLAE